MWMTILALVSQPTDLMGARMPASWSHIDPSGWVFFDEQSNGQALHFVLRGDRRGLVWVRSEYRPDPRGASLSTRSLIEADCETNQFRMAEMETFAENNLSAPLDRWTPPGSWEEAEPGTPAAFLVLAACNTPE